MEFSSTHNNTLVQREVSLYPISKSIPAFSAPFSRISQRLEQDQQNDKETLCRLPS